MRWILGLGDLGANGMGIPIGNWRCTARPAASPHRVLPVVVDVGTNNVELREDPLYLGLKRPRLTGAAYYEVVDEFVTAVLHRWPKTLIQFEDFESSVAQPLLDRYRDKILCFNDDIQGTGATVLAGVLACLRQTGKTAQDLKDQRMSCVKSTCDAGAPDNSSLSHFSAMSGVLLRSAAKPACHAIEQGASMAWRTADDSREAP